MNAFAYVVAFILLLSAAFIAISWGRNRMPGRLVALTTLTAASTLAMIKIRCFLSDDFNCGFMSFLDGFTWHIAPVFLGGIFAWSAFAIFLDLLEPKGVIVWLDKSGTWLAPGIGLWVAVVWEILPVSVIHLPKFGGWCPNIPIICHDVPLAGWGGLLYWCSPFLAWTAFDVGRGVWSAFRKRSPADDELNEALRRHRCDF